MSWLPGDTSTRSDTWYSGSLCQGAHSRKRSRSPGSTHGGGKASVSHCRQEEYVWHPGDPLGHLLKVHEQVQQPQPEKGIVINDSDTNRWPLRLVNVLAKEWRNLEWIVEEGVLITALSPATMVCPTNLPPLNFPQEEALQTQLLLPYVYESEQLEGVDGGEYCGIPPPFPITEGTEDLATGRTAPQNLQGPPQLAGRASSSSD